MSQLTPYKNSQAVVTGLAVLALLYRLSSWLFMPAESPMNILGVPYSDARGWDTLGELVSQGQGMRGFWAADRPLYAYFLAAWYKLFGADFRIAIVVNLCMSALTISLGFAILRRAFSEQIAFATSIFLIFSSVHQSNAEQVLTEPLGLFLTMLALYTLFRGLETNQIRYFAAAGFIFALEALSRLLTLPWSLLLIPIIAWMTFRKKASLRYLAVAVYTLSLAIPLAFWLLRQHLTHGITTLSPKGFEILYAVTNPTHAQWSEEIDQELVAKGIPFTPKARYDYFSAGIRSNLLLYGKEYSVRVLKAWGNYCQLVERQDPIIWLLAFFLAVSAIWNRLRAYRTRYFFTTIALALGYYALNLPLLRHHAAWMLPLIGMFWSVRNNRYAVILATGTLIIGVPLALLNETTRDRYLIGVSWLAVAFFLHGTEAVFRRSPLLPSSVSASPLPVWITRLICALFIVIGSTNAWIIAEAYLSPAHEMRPIELSQSQRIFWFERAETFVPTLDKMLPDLPPHILGENLDPVKDYQQYDGQTFVYAGKLLRQYYQIPGQSKFKNSSRLVAAQPQPYNVFFVDNYAGRILSTIPETWLGKYVVVVGRLNIDPKDPHLDSRVIIDTKYMGLWNERHTAQALAEIYSP